MEQGRIHGRFSHVLLGRGSNDTVYTTSGARQVVTDCLHRSNSLIAPIWLIFAISDGPTDGQTDGQTDGPTEWLIECVHATNTIYSLSH